MSWTLGITCPSCPTCGVALLPRIGHREPLGEGFWCARCKLEMTTAAEAAPGAVAAPAKASAGPVTMAKGRVDGFSYAGQVEPDGSVSLGVRGVGTPSQMKALEQALLALRVWAEFRQERLRGADRWRFRREGDFYVVRVFDEERALELFTAGPRKLGRGPRRCSACHGPIMVGARAYRATLKTGESGCGRVIWREVRICAGCVESVAEPAARPALRLIKTEVTSSPTPPRSEG